MGRYKHILLVDDDEDDQMFFTDVLQTVDRYATCIVAKHGLAALELLRANFPSLPEIIFLDLNMPRMNGLEFLHLLKQEEIYAAYKHIPVVVLTTSNAQAEDCYALGATAAIKKPSSMAIYQTMLEILLNNDLVNNTEQVRLQLHPFK